VATKAVQPDLGGHLLEREHPSRTRGTLHGVARSQVVVELLQRLDEQEVDWKPNRAPPVRVGAKNAGAGLSWLVIHPVLHAVDGKHIGILTMGTRERADAVRGEEFARIQHVPEHVAQPMPID
jgi:hypothetical protein